MCSSDLYNIYLDSLVEADTISVIREGDSSLVVSPLDYIESDDPQPLFPSEDESGDRKNQFFLREDQFVLKF